MFACLRRISAEVIDPSCLRRGIASTPIRSLPRRSRGEEENEEQFQEEEAEDIRGEEGSKVIVYRRTSRRLPGDHPTADPWLTSEGKVYRHPKKGPNWLGGECPFPMNPTFNPPPPLASTTRDAIYNSFLRGSTLRWLSSAYGISLKRVDAILRLKGLEESWKKVRFHEWVIPISCSRQRPWLFIGYRKLVLTRFILPQNKPLQTGFLAGMEYMLQPQQRTLSAHNAAIESRLADQQDEAQGQDNTRDRYQRLFWEPVVENEDPVVPASIERGQEALRQARQARRESKNDPVLLTGRKFPKGADRVRPPKVMYAPSGSAPNRPLIKFMDVGGKFIDVNDRLKRMKHGGKRQRSHVKRSLKLA